MRARMIVAAALGAVAIAAAPPATVPVRFVGCPSDGQTGPTPGPRNGPTPHVPAAMAARLSWYAGGEGGVLAPAGWTCRAVSGSNGWTMLVTPAAHPGALLADEPKIAGMAVVRQHDAGNTSGRFAVAAVAAALFPAAHAFVARVRAEGADMIDPLRVTVGDRILARTARHATFVSASGALGGRWPLARDGAPVRGVYALGAGPTPDLDSVRVRLPAADAALAEAIVAQGGV